MTLDNSNQQELINCRVAQALESLDDVRFLIENSRYRLAMNRIYYGIFYILSALAVKHHFKTRKHQQLIGWFNRKYIRELGYDKRYSDIVFKAFDRRQRGDYEDFVEISKEEVTEMYELMQLFIDKFRKDLEISG